MNFYPNIPVADLARTRAFFTALGFQFDDRFADDTGIAMRINDQAHVMMLTHEKFLGFAPGRKIGQTEMLLALQVDSREAVDAMIAKAVKAGGQTFRDPEDHGFLYGHGFTDPDGHIWEAFWMNPEAVPDA